MTDPFPGYTLRAKIDYITIADAYLPTRKDGLGAVQDDFDGRVELAARDRAINRLSVHDPSVRDLQFLVDHVPETEVWEMEVAVDFLPVDPEPDLEALEAFQRQLFRGVAPHHHADMSWVIRREADPLGGRVARLTTLEAKYPTGTKYWYDRAGRAEVKLYVKTLDNGRPVPRPFVRLEVKLMRGALQLALANYVGLLPRFMADLRRYVTPYFWIASGVSLANLPRLDRWVPGPRRDAAMKEAARSQARLDSDWDRFGAPMAYRNRMRGRLVLRPDAQANRRIGKALSNLQAAMKALQPPKSVTDYDEWIASKAALLLTPEEIERDRYRRLLRDPAPGR